MKKNQNEQQLIRVNHPYGHDVWKLNPASKYPAAVARRAGMSLKQFCIAYSQSEFPRCIRGHADYGALSHSCPPEFRVTPCEDAALWQRIERAAEFEKKDVTEYVWWSLCIMLESSEEDMIVDRRSGRVIGSAVEFEEAARYSYVRHAIEPGVAGQVGGSAA